jgi:hypothetical protein
MVSQIAILAMFVVAFFIIAKCEGYRRKRAWHLAFSIGDGD